MAERHHPPNISVTDQAIRWFVRLHAGDCTETERAQCADWLASDDSHRREYERVAAMWTEMDALKTVPNSPGVMPGRSSLAPGSSPGVFRRAGHPRQQKDGAAIPEKKLTLIELCAGPRVTLALVAILMVALVSLWLWHQPIRYATAKGERKTVTLSDGSAIVLNTDTALFAQVLPWRRTVRLDRGEALFTVAADAHWPFIVTAGAGTIRVLGTTFNIHKKPDQVVVTVLEGAVEVTTATSQGMYVQRQLSHGTQLAYAATGALLQERLVDAQAVTAWREGRLVFDALPLGEVIRELARYRAGEIGLADSTLQELRVSGVFNTDDFDGLLRAIAQMLQVTIRQIGEDVIEIAPAKPQRNNPANSSPHFRVKPLL